MKYKNLNKITIIFDLFFNILSLKNKLKQFVNYDILSIYNKKIIYFLF